MSLSTVCFIPLLACAFSAVLCMPQISSQLSDGISNDEAFSTGAESVASLIAPSNMAFLPGTGNDFGTLHPTDNTLEGAGFLGGDPGSAALNILPGEADQDGILEAFDAESPAANTLLLAQVQEPPAHPGETSTETPDQTIENTPGEEAAGENADAKTPPPARKPGKFGEGLRARYGYDDDKCPEGAKWACCNRKWGKVGYFCIWLTDNSVCVIKACCFPNAKGNPDEWCPDTPPAKRVFNAINGIIEWFEPALGPSTGGAVGGAGAVGAGGAALDFP